MTEVAGLFLQVAELSVSAAWMIPAVCALNLIPRAASHAPGAVLSGGAGAQGADAAGSVSGIAPAAEVLEPELGFVLAHERAHLRRRDHIWKPLGWLLLSVHWFNPLVWLAYALFCRDVEYACDESVVGGLDADGRRAYARALLECSSPRRAAACPLAFGETGAKARVKGVLNYKKPARWALIVVVAACAVLAACFLTEPKPAEPALPEGLSLSEYEGDMRMILPMVYEDMGSAPDYWRSSGVIADFNAAQCLRWEGEQIAEVLIYSNHMQIDNLGPVTGLSAPAYLTRNTYDLCTAAEAVGGEVPVSAYWCVYIAELGASTGMLVSLEASRFSAEDTVRLAQSLSR